MLKPKQKLRWVSLPKRIARRDFTRYVAPHLAAYPHGPKPAISAYKTFNYILHVLHTGMQWNQLQPYKNEIHPSNVHKWHLRWSSDGSYQRLLEASVVHLRQTHQLDTSLIHGDGTNTVAKKGDPASATVATSTRRATKSSPLRKTTGSSSPRPPSGR